MERLIVLMESIEHTLYDFNTANCSVGNINLLSDGKIIKENISYERAIDTITKIEFEADHYEPELCYE